jgi:hypothetical protein
MNNFKAPRDKLICILNCCKVIFGKKDKQDEPYFISHTNPRAHEAGKEWRECRYLFAVIDIRHHQSKSRSPNIKCTVSK